MIAYNSDYIDYTYYTDCTSTEGCTGEVLYISERGYKFKTIKEAAIDDIKQQPFFGVSHER